MNAESKLVDPRYLTYLVPISELTQDNLHDLANQTRVEFLSEGRNLFKKGTIDNSTYYLLSGEITLFGDGEEKTITGGTRQARYPLDNNRPHSATARAMTDIHFIRIENNLLDILLTWDQNAGYKVTEIEAEPENEYVAGDAENDWMTSMLRSQIFHRIPPSNIQAVFMHMEAMNYSKGDTVIRQGEEGDYYYYIQKGRCLVTHTGKSGKEMKLAELSAGSSFGEDALVSGNKRNANVIMLTNGTLMRLAKDDFQKLLREPILKKVDIDEAEALIKSGAIWLDVRLESEYRNSHIPGSINIPLYLLRFKAETLDKSKQYIVYCDTGRRSASASFLLSERGFDALLLEGGMLAQHVKQ